MRTTTLFPRVPDRRPGDFVWDEGRGVFLFPERDIDGFRFGAALQAEATDQVLAIAGPRDAPVIIAKAPRGALKPRRRRTRSPVSPIGWTVIGCAVFWALIATLAINAWLGGRPW